MKTYRPSGSCSLAGTFTFVTLAVCGAIITGGLAHFVGRFIYLIILFPFLMGLGAAVAVSLGVVQGKCRNYTMAAVIALFAGVITYGSMHFFDYMNFRSEVARMIMEEAAEGEEATASRKEVLANVDSLLKESTGSAGMLGFMKYSASEGISIGKAGRSGANIGTTGTVVYWFLEFGAILFIAFSGAVKAKEPFCENCDVWYDESDLVQSSHDTADSITTALKKERFAELPSKLEFTGSAPCVRIKGSICPNCNETDAVISVDAVSINKKGNESEKRIHSQMIPMTDFTAIINGIETEKAGAKRSSEQETIA